VNGDMIVGPPGYSSEQLIGLLVYGSTAHILLKLAMTGCLIFVFVFLALAAGLMAVYVYGKHLDQQIPDPIYLNEELLLSVVLKSAREQLGSDVDPNVTEMKRNEDGGVSVSLRQEGDLVAKGDVKVREDRTWKVVANRWGRVNGLEETGLRVVQVLESA